MYRRMAFVLGVLAIAAGSVLAANPGKESATAAPDRRVPAGSTAPGPEADGRAVGRRTLSPMHQEIMAAVDEEQAMVAELNARFLAATSLDEKIAVQKEIESIKRAGQILVFEIQLRYARAAGREQVVKELERVIDAVKNPKLPYGEDGKILIQPGQDGTMETRPR